MRPAGDRPLATPSPGRDGRCERHAVRLSAAGHSQRDGGLRPAPEAATEVGTVPDRGATPQAPATRDERTSTRPTKEEEKYTRLGHTKGWPQKKGKRHMEQREKVPAPPLANSPKRWQQSTSQRKKPQHGGWWGGGGRRHRSRVSPSEATRRRAPAQAPREPGERGGTALRPPHPKRGRRAQTPSTHLQHWTGASPQRPHHPPLGGGGRVGGPPGHHPQPPARARAPCQPQQALTPRPATGPASGAPWARPSAPPGRTAPSSSPAAPRG